MAQSNPAGQQAKAAESDSSTGSAGTGAATGTAYSVSDYAQQVAGAAGRAKEYISGRASENITKPLNEVREYTQQQPGVALLLSALSGFMLGLLLPSTTGRRRKQEEESALLAETKRTAISYTVGPAGEVARRTAISYAVEPVRETARRYVISMPTGFHRASGRYGKQLSALHKTHEANVIDALGDDADKLALLTDSELARLRAEAPGLVIEPNIRYKKFRHPLLDDFQELSVTASANSKTITIRAVDWNTRTPLKNVSIYLMLDENRRTGFRGVTDGEGICQFTTRASTRKFDALMALPQSGHWNRRLTNVEINDEYEVALRPLPLNRGAFYDWGHQFAQMQDGLSYDGRGVKIGIIDSGIRQDHPGLKPSGGYNCVFGEDPSLWSEDDDGHGTHCAGIVAATLINGVGVKGYVPKAEIRAYRVFAKNSDGAETFDIAKAIARAVEDKCDIISMSLGSNTPQSAIRTRVEHAYDKGVLCIAATGNEGRAVAFPAAFPSVVGVGAFGKFQSYPDDTLHKATETNLISPDGQYYYAKFSNFGENLDLCAPGVAILSTVPGGGYSAWDGTSMACPQVAGMAALALAAHPGILNATRDAGRVESLLTILKSRSQAMGFGAPQEGSGYLTVPPLLVA
jgi:subtilisin